MRWKTIKRLWRIFRSKPHVIISRSGWKTDNPRVNVTLHSRTGAIGMYDLPDTDQGNAQAEMDAASVSHITQLPLIDRRPSQQ